MEIVIKIPENTYKYLAELVDAGEEPLGYFERVIMRGTPLPEHLNKIKDEIDEKISHYEHFSSSNTANGLMMAKEIIDKYIEGSDSE